MHTPVSFATRWIAEDLQAMLDTLADVQILALTLFGEARSEPIEGIVSVGCVIRNRVHADLGDDGRPDWWGEGYRGVCLAPYQFSMWHRFPGREGVDRNYDEVVATVAGLVDGKRGGAAIEECAWVAQGIDSSAIRDRVKGCTHYHTVKMQPRPAWARAYAPSVQVGTHVFYAGIR